MADQGPRGIAWTEQTWNPVRGCTRVSAGCVECYAEKIAARFSGPGLAYEGLAKRTKAGARWTGVVQLVEERLEDPIRWQKPRRIFVNSMSDLFHEKLGNHDIARVFGVMARAPRHTYQVLTKRDWRLEPFFASASARIHFFGVAPVAGPVNGFGVPRDGIVPANIWLGVSIEDQDAATLRIPGLLRASAMTRWLSVEPMLGPIDLRLMEYADVVAGMPRGSRPGRVCDFINWVVVGGESGSNARPFDIVWARSIIAQCRAAGVPVFMKQVGADAREYGSRIGPDYNGVPSGRTGGDPMGWPADLRVREYPRVFQP